VAIEGIGPKIAESVHGYFRDPASLQFLEKLEKAGANLADRSPDAAGPLAGLTFVVTGRLRNHSRLQIEQRIKDLGGNVGDSVTKKTDYLVAGEDAGSKLARAQKLGTAILDEDGFERLVKDRGLGSEAA
jgi:DNA ligase (NAD+)